MAEAAKKFLKWGLDWDIEDREITDIPYDKNLIHSGDFIAITRFDGKGPMQMYGDGTHVDHCVMALWMDDEVTGKRELFIVESQSGWYWPTDRVQRNRWEEWL